MKLWIIGARGLLGQTLKNLCDARGVPNVSTGRDEADVTSKENLLKVAEAEAPTHIVNCAAYTDVDGAERSFEEAFAINAIGAENVGAVAREFGCKLVHISTDYVFGGAEKTTPFSETDVCHPIGIYGKSKWEGEQRLLDEFPQCCILRTSWLFGAQGKNFVSGLLGWLKTKEQIKAVDDQTGRVTFCRDLAETILALLCHSGIFHFANEGAVNRYQIAQGMHAEARQLGLEIACKEILPVSSKEFPTAAKRPTYSVLCTNKIERVLGGKPRSWNVVLQEFLTHAAK